MGVAVAKFMVAAMGGKLAIASRAGADALYAFTIEFPVLPARARAARAPTLRLAGGAAGADGLRATRSSACALSNLLRGWRMVPLEADNAAMALALLERMRRGGRRRSRW